jgi:aspartyl protease family protein
MLFAAFMAGTGSDTYIERVMDIATIWDGVSGLIGDLPKSTLLLAACAAIALSVIGSIIRRYSPGFGGFLRGISTLALMGILAAVVLQVARIDPRFDLALPDAGLPAQTVEGDATRVPLAGDGHYWIDAEINGVPARFLVDTGATLTTVNTQVAEAAGLEPRRGGIPVRLNTANGAVAAQMTTIDELRFGNVAARGLDAVIAPNIGPTNVLGMNLLSRLKGWGVRDGELVLEPNNPQPALETDN